MHNHFEKKVTQIAMIALGHILDAQHIEAVAQSMDLSRLRAQMIALGVCDAQVSDMDVAKLYFSKRCSALSPNAFFDESWYLATYPDVELAVEAQGLVSGFVHFIRHGLDSGRWPNPVLAAQGTASIQQDHETPVSILDDDTYLRINPAAAAFLAAFPCLTPLAHYNAYGRRLGYQIESRPPQQGLDDEMGVVRAAFDGEFYRRTYLVDVECDDPLAHYLNFGAALGYSPNKWFDERWYRAFYLDIQAACSEGWLPSGFFHYLYTGRSEGRLPRFNLTQALEARMPGVTSPTLLSKAEELENRLNPNHGVPQFDATAQGPATVWIVLPTLNPDIMFGGYRTVLWLVVALVKAKFKVKIVCVQDEPNLQYFLLREGSAAVRAAFSTVSVMRLTEIATSSYSAFDLFMAYSAWDLPLCARLAANTKHPLPFFLTQEYEPVFHDNGSHRALLEAIYRIPHYAIINSAMLCKYFMARGLGVFSNNDKNSVRSKYVVFEHRIMQLPRQSVAAMSSRSTRLLVIYARPEAHAARNVFEIAVLALRRLCKENFFGPEWRFEGVGALSKLPPVRLGEGHEIILREKQSETDYASMCGSMDIGLSLMYAPHPSVMPFEFATTGSLVVTNTYENRSASELVSICANIVPCELSIESVSEAIRTAAGRVSDFRGRVRNSLVPNAGGWEEIFNSKFVESTFGKALPTDTATHEEVSVIPKTRRPKPSLHGSAVREHCT
ncbi:rhamnosyltransferase WsaF family glycosyltransferase [Acidisoma silvae]|uniref:WsaF C-terminal domain-containing protein n=1 Tax=Acidisoma silvae TaxID=2802396 RepID=A0A963YMR6_9PROT|nr:hypothetical protein [Acidisoma silvae]MCB8873610.1 hypothetical protein [Acidisoma silvae]